MLERVWRKGNPLALLVGWKLIQPLWRTVWRFLKKLKIELSYNPAIPLLGIYPEKTITQKESCGEEPRWWSRRTCSHSLLREHQNHN